MGVTIKDVAKLAGTSTATVSKVLNGSYSISEDNYTSYTNKEISTLTGEEISEESFCFLSSLFKNDINDVDKYSNVVRANCYKIFCSKKQHFLGIRVKYIIYKV